MNGRPSMTIFRTSVLFCTDVDVHLWSGTGRKSFRSERRVSMTLRMSGYRGISLFSWLQADRRGICGLAHWDRRLVGTRARSLKSLTFIERSISDMDSLRKGISLHCSMCASKFVAYILLYKMNGIWLTLATRCRGEPPWGLIHILLESFHDFSTQA